MKLRRFHWSCWMCFIRRMRSAKVNPIMHQWPVITLTHWFRCSSYSWDWCTISHFDMHNKHCMDKKECYRNQPTCARNMNSNIGTNDMARNPCQPSLGIVAMAIRISKQEPRDQNNWKMKVTPKKWYARERSRASGKGYWTQQNRCMYRWHADRKCGII